LGYNLLAGQNWEEDIRRAGEHRGSHQEEGPVAEFPSWEGVQGVGRTDYRQEVEREEGTRTPVLPD